MLRLVSHVTEIIPRKFPLAQLAVQPVQVRAKYLDHLAAVQAEFVRGAGDIAFLALACLGKSAELLIVDYYSRICTIQQLMLYVAVTFKTDT